MKISTTLAVLAFCIFSIMSCTKEPCTSDIIGIYEGTSTNDSNKFSGRITISQSSEGDFEVLIDDKILNSGEDFYKGVVTEDCNRINIPLQNLTTSTNIGYALDGFFEIDDKNLTGELTIVVGTFGDVLTYDMVKL